MDFIKNIYKSIDTEKKFMYRKNIKTRRSKAQRLQSTVRLTNLTN